jgi:flagellar hook-associated protein 3 FlgL
MRITPTMMTNTFVTNVNSLANQIVQYESEAATGEAYQFPSDNPAAIAGTMDLNALGGQIASYQAAAESATQWLNSGANVLSEVSKLWGTVQNLAVEASNASLTQTDRQAIADQLSENVTTLKELLSTPYNGQPLFAFATGTASAPPPLVFQIGPTETVTVNLSGSESSLYASPPSTGNIFTQLEQDLSGLAQEVQNGTPPSSWTVTLSQIQTDQSYISNAQALLGGRLQRVQQQTSYLNTLSDTVSQGVASLDGANLADVATQLNQAEQAYQAALETGAQILPITLLNYIKP